MWKVTSTISFWKTRLPVSLFSPVHSIDWGYVLASKLLAGFRRLEEIKIYLTGYFSVSSDIAILEQAGSKQTASET